MTLRSALLGLVTCTLLAAPVAAADDDVVRLVAALLAETPLVGDLRSLTDEVGGRPTGSAANQRAVEWALERFAEAGVEAKREAFGMPMLWLERSSTAAVRGEVEFPALVAAMPYSTATPPGGLRAPLVDGGFGTVEDFERLGESVHGAFILVETEELRDVAGLFKEYANGSAIESRAFAAEVAGVVYMGSRPSSVLYRHNASKGKDNRHPMLVMERAAAARALRLLRRGRSLDLEVSIDVATGDAYQSYNVIGEIKGSRQPEEFVVIGAHLDSWALGTGALDNGCNVALVIDIARQMRRLGLQPRRTIRFALFNGEEQGLLGSWGYVKGHADELDRHVMASSYDIGSGRITGFFTNGRPEVLEAVGRALVPVGGMGPYENLDVPIVGTDTYDFMVEGIGNLVANQESADYGPNYHARTDTFDRVDLTQLRLNAAVAAAVTWGFANMEVDWSRQTRGEIQTLIDSTNLGDQMKMFGLWESWERGERGRREQRDTIRNPSR